MNRQDAIAEIKRMRGAASPTAYFASLKQRATATSTDLPVSLAEAHGELEAARAMLSESVQTNAKMAVALSLERDMASVETLLQKGKLTIPMANKLIALCETKRAEQIVRLAEGDEEAAMGADGDVAAIMEMLGELPATVATDVPVDPALAAPVPEGDPNAVPPNTDEQLDALAREIMAKEGLAYPEALLKAEAILAGAGAGAPAGPPMGAPVGAPMGGM